MESIITPPLPRPLVLFLDSDVLLFPKKFLSFFLALLAFQSNFLTIVDVAFHPT
jgi:hypothetical protein